MKNPKKTWALSIKLLSITAMILFLCSCSKNDDDIPPFEPIVQPITLAGNLDLTNREKSLNIDLSNGGLLEQSDVTASSGIIAFNGAYYNIQSNSISKTNEIGGTVIWEKAYFNPIDRSYELTPERSVFFETTLFFAYKIQNNTTYTSQYFLEALDIENGITLWVQEVPAEIMPYIYDNRLATTMYPNGNSPLIIQYRNKELGDVEIERTIEERVGAFHFSGDLIIATSWANRVFALDRNLNPVWNFDTGAENTGQSFIQDDQFVFYSRDRHVYSLHKDTGVQTWKTALPESNILGIAGFENSIHVGQQTSANTLTITSINAENGVHENTFETPMSDDYYTTKLIFYKDFLILITSPTSDESDEQIEVKLIHLPSSEIVWSSYFNIKLSFLQVEVSPND